jgi:hypothetical protein
MDIRIVGVDFPPTRQIRQRSSRQFEESLEDSAQSIEKIEVYLVEFSCHRSKTGTLCSAVVYLHGYPPMLIEEAADDLQRATFRCVTSVKQAVEERLRQRRPGPAGMSLFF